MENERGIGVYHRRSDKSIRQQITFEVSTSLMTIERRRHDLGLALKGIGGILSFFFIATRLIVTAFTWNMVDNFLVSKVFRLKTHEKRQFKQRRNAMRMSSVDSKTHIHRSSTQMERDKQAFSSTKPL
jgi:hypothetical protein